MSGAIGGLNGGDPQGSASLEPLAPQLVAPTTGQVLGASFADAFARNQTVQGVRAGVEEAAAKGGPEGDVAPSPVLQPDELNKQYGIQGVLSFDSAMPQQQAEDLREHHIAELQRQDILQRNVSSLATGGLARFLAGGAAQLLDPLNLAAGLIPGVPEARIAAMLGDAATGAAGRAMVRALSGATAGAAGMAALQPIDYAFAQRNHDDWDMGTALSSIAFGGLLGGVLHPGLGLIEDAKGLPEWAQRVAGQPRDLQEAQQRGAIAAVLDDRPIQASKAADLYYNLSQQAFHGTPYIFDQFDSSNIGSGEGAAAYGHGLYFAGSRKVAEYYRSKLSNKQFIDLAADSYHEGVTPDEAMDALMEHPDLSPGQKSLLTALQKDDFLGFDYPHQAIAAAFKNRGEYELSEETQAALKNQGRLFHVSIPAEENYLDWDKTLAEQHPNVQRALARSGLDMGAFADKTGADLYNALRQEARYAHPAYAEGGIPPADWDMGNPAAKASDVLAATGLKGIKYLDGTSRMAGEGSHNFVVFSDKDVRIEGYHDASGYTQAQRDAQQIADSQTKPITDQDADFNRQTAQRAATAPEITGDPAKDIAAAQQHAADFNAYVQQEKAAGRWGASDDAALDKINQQEALGEGDAKAYQAAANCLVNGARNA